MNKAHIAERYAKALANRDLATQGELMHPDIVARYPQSGEIIRGRDNYLKMCANDPHGLPEGEVTSVKGDARTAVLSRSLPMMTSKVTVYGGDDFIIEGVATYADGSVYNAVVIIRLQGHLVIEEVSYFAAPFDPPEWRREYVEQAP